MTFDAENMPELMELLSRRDANNRKLENELNRRPALERDAGFIARVADAVQRLEHDGARLPITQELRARLAPEAPEAPAPQQRQTLAGAAAGSAIGAMAKLYDTLRPPAPATPAPWEQMPQPLGDRLRAFEQRRAETAVANQVQAARMAGEQAVSALDGLSALPGGATLARVRDAAQSDPGGIQGVIEGMRPGGRHARLRTAFETALQDRKFTLAYNGAVRDVMAYGQARLKVDGEGLDALDRTIGQGVQALPSRSYSKSVQDDLAEKARQFTELLKNAVLRVGAALSSAPKPGASPGLTMAP